MDDTVVSTPNGKVKGKVVDLKLKDAKLVYSYRNIPFAKPPVGSLRFMPPQPADPWEGIKDGTVLGNITVYPAAFDEGLAKYFPSPDDGGPSRVVDEDSLHLSVYTPRPEKGKKLPVMVWIYGGGFAMGSERYYDGSVLAGLNDVIIVVPNYRVGALGFLSLGRSSICSGNQGIMDQQLALKWVQNNIEAFGGDKDNVTIFGESAGGVSVNFHVISPLSRGLFHKAISHSGTCNLPGMFHSEESHTKKMKRFLEKIKITEKDENKILEALQKMSTEDLLKAQMELMMEQVNFVPMVDGKVFPKSPDDSIKDKDFTKVPYIIGCNSSEGHGILAMSAGADFEKGMDEESVRKFLFFKLTDEGYQKCKDFYVKADDQDETRYSKMFGNILGASFVARSVQVASTYSDAGADIYFYYGNFQLKMYHDEEFGKDMAKKVDWCVCDHGDDVMMTLGLPLVITGMSFTEEEKVISRRFMTYLTNFARTGNPNKSKKVEITWPKYQSEKTHLVVATPFSTGKNLAQEETDFWLNVMPQHINKEE